MFKPRKLSIQPKARTLREAGYTVVETIITLAVAAVVAFIAVPVVTSSWSVAPAAALKSDMALGAQLMDSYMQSHSLQTSLGMSASAVPNIGVYAANAQLVVKVNEPTDGTDPWYCLKGSFKGQTSFYLSNSKATVPTSPGVEVCPA
jgi:Tfp pilus assembly protein PilE